MGYILITGGLGYIGSHVAVELVNRNYKIIIIDNLSNCKSETLNIIQKITQKDDIIFFYIDIRDSHRLYTDIFSKYKIDCVIHMAGSKAVAESIQLPLNYYDNNVSSTIKLLEVMKVFKCYKIVFSSSATVYGKQDYPVDESAQIGSGITNPYGKTKYMIEEILNDLYQSDNQWNIIILRYFNPVGCHESGLLKENPNNLPNNLFPHILRNVNQINSFLSIFGNNYQTYDGTCIRDFIHVVDLANGHATAIQKINQNGVHIYNLGTGKGTSVLELINQFIKVNNVNINYQFKDPRPGDLPITYALVNKAFDQLGWKAEKTLEDICRDGFKSLS